MTTMTVTALGHSSVRIERDGSALVIDPGSFSDRSGLADADGVLITHEHPDHVDVPAVAEALNANEPLWAWAPAGVAAQLMAAAAPADRVHALEAGETLSAAGFEVRALGGAHAVIHPDLPPIANLAYLIDGAVLHPGDSFTMPPDGARIEVLLLPVSAPWMALREAVEY